MPSRTATCSCHQLTVTCTGDPDRVVICNCLACQRRTGSPFGAGAYYEQTQVQVQGNSTQYTRTSDAGRWLTNHFCPNCGSTVFWFLEMAPTLVGVAVGSFNEPDFPRPVRAVWCATKHGWIDFPADVEQFTGPMVRPPPA